jgi:octanoyl-[GcvH]:protein N-octanoyltransferase
MRVARSPLRLCLDDVDPTLAGPAGDTAVSRALLQRVDAGELPATLRLSRPPRVVAFSSRDARTPGFVEAVAAAHDHGFAAVQRLAGGRPAVFTPATIAFALAEPADPPAASITARFRVMAEALRDAFVALGVDAHVGAVPGEYCPGDWSVNARGVVKLAGVGQRLLRRGAHTGGVVVVDDAAAITTVLADVHAAMGIAWDPAATGAVAAEAPVTWEAVRSAIATAFAATHDLEAWSLDPPTLALARELAPEHLVDPVAAMPASGLAPPAPSAPS